MLPTGLSSTVDRWVEKRIADYVWGDVVLTPEFRKWMETYIGERFGDKLWCWDHYREEREVIIYFTNPKHAVLFKLAWL